MGASQFGSLAVGDARASILTITFDNQGKSRSLAMASEEHHPRVHSPVLVACSTVSDGKLKKYLKSMYGFMEFDRNLMKSVY